MPHGLIISIRLYDDRYNGAGEWPPAPARLFQALIAGAGISGPLEAEERDALAWMETLGQPVIAAPQKRDGHAVMLYVPNNDLDKVGGDLKRIAEIRGSTKTWKPRLLQDATPFKYGWTFESDSISARRAQVICALAERLYQFGRGVDFACAWGETVDQEQVESELLNYRGTIYKPSSSINSGLLLKCPIPGSLKSIEDRYRSFGRRFQTESQGRLKTIVFVKSSVVQFATISYDNPILRILFDLRKHSDAGDTSAAWPLSDVVRLVELLRDKAAERLKAVFSAPISEIERVLVGRSGESGDQIAASGRVRILPLPSIGHQHADCAIRRVLIEVPPGCSLGLEDVQWAISGLNLILPGEGETGVTVTAAMEQGMLNHYGVGALQEHRIWRTVTPAVLPASAMRRRIEPTGRAREAKGGLERLAECERAAVAVIQALRHAGLSVQSQTVRVQREPFESNGSRVEEFARNTRFSKHSLWHVEIEFTNPVSGPLVIGNGRFLGLGLMAPVRGQ